MCSLEARIAVARYLTSHEDEGDHPSYFLRLLFQAVQKFMDALDCVGEDVLIKGMEIKLQEIRYNY